jgi:alpha-glucosidase
LTRYTHEGIYITDPENRTVITGGCGSYQVIEDTVDTSINTPTFPVNKTDPRNTFFFGAGSGSGPGDPINPPPGDIQYKRYAPGGDNPGSMQGLQDRNLLYPNYSLPLWDGELSNQAAPSNIIHANGVAEYDVHNLFGSMMGNHSRTALLSRRPGKRPFMSVYLTLMSPRQSWSIA